MLHIIKNTKLAQIYKDKPFKILTKEEYVKIVVEQLELLRPELIIERLTGDPIKEDLIEPEWLLNKTSVLNEIDKLMAKLNTYQGIKYKD